MEALFEQEGGKGDDVAWRYTREGRRKELDRLKLTLRTTPVFPRHLRAYQNIVNAGRRRKGEE